jgi:hypothetical protein
MSQLARFPFRNVLEEKHLQEEERSRLQRGQRYDPLELGGAKERPINIVFFLFW